MAKEPAYLNWTVHENGYRWQDGCLVRATGPEPVPVLVYNPLEETGLFRTFADLEPARDAIARFAGRYGMLARRARPDEPSKNRPCLIPRGEPDAEGRQAMQYAEPLGFWVNETQAIRETVSLWEAARGNDQAELGRRIVWSEKGVRYRSPQGGSAWIATESEPDLLARLPDGDLIGPALHYVQQTVNAKLADRVSAQLFWNRGQLSLYVVPADLLGCLWFQFAQAVDGGREYRRCDRCGKWFELGGSANRRDKRFCTPTCKAAYHRKHRRAQ